MIHKETWHIESDDRAMRELVRLYSENLDPQALFELGRLYLRVKKMPEIPDPVWSQIFPIVTKMVQEESPEEWASHFMWRASQATGHLPDVSKEEVEYIPFGLAPKITYREGWTVLTNGSSSEGDFEDLGMVDVEGERISYRNHLDPEPWKTHNFDQEMDLDDLLQWLERDFGLDTDSSEPHFRKILDREDAQEEFGDTYNDDAWGNETHPYDESPMSEVVGGEFEVFIPRADHLERILQWLQE